MFASCPLARCQGGDQGYWSIVEVAVVGCGRLVVLLDGGGAVMLQLLSTFRDGISHDASGCQAACPMAPWPYGVSLVGSRRSMNSCVC